MRDQDSKIGSIYRYIVRHNRNPVVVGMFTMFFPMLLLRSIYRQSSNRAGWNGKKLCFTLSFDCDYPEDVQAIPHLLGLLDRYSYKASFACVGAWIEKYPKEHIQIVEHGHEILNHTYSHPDNELLNPGRRFRFISREEKKREIERCHDVCLSVIGYEPKGCRIPHFKNLFTEEIYGILLELGYKYSSSTWLTGTTSCGLPFITEEGIAEFPLSVCPKHPFTVFDTWHSLNAERLSHKMIHRGPEKYLALFEDLIELGLDTGAYLNVYLDPADIRKIPDFQRILEVLSSDSILVQTYEEYIANNSFMEKPDR